MNPLRRHPEINWSIVDDDVVVVDPRLAEDRIHVLRGASAIVWQRLDGSDLDELIARLRHEFELEPGQATSDVTAAVEMLAAADLLDRPDITHRPRE